MARQWRRRFTSGLFHATAPISAGAGCGSRLFPEAAQPSKMSAKVVHRTPTSRSLQGRGLREHRQLDTLITGRVQTQSR